MSKKKQTTPSAPASDVGITLVVGYPASGKSTLVKERFPGHAHVNRDAMGKSIKDLLPVVRQHLSAGMGVVTDYLFATREARKDFVALAKELGVPCRCVVLDTSIEDAQVNVVSRLIKHFGHLPSDAEIKAARHPNVFPPAVLYKYRKEYEKPDPSEGFDAVEVVKFTRLPWAGQKRALVLDFDGTLRECPSGAKFPTCPKDIKIRSRVVEVLQRFHDAGWLLLGASNQSGIAKGDLTEETCRACFAATNKLLGFDIEVLFCPHRVPPVSCYCRKPGVGLVMSHVVKHDLNPAACVFVGDMTTDKTCAGRVGMPYADADDFFYGDGYKKFL